MKWYCIRPRCLPADQVKDMLVPEKCGSAPEMDGVSELPDGFREATITCLEFINEVGETPTAGGRFVHLLCSLLGVSGTRGLPLALPLSGSERCPLNILEATV